MTISAAATRTTPPAIITHSIARISGVQQADISVYHARSTDARISMTFSGILMVIYSCQAAQDCSRPSPPPARTWRGCHVKSRPPESIPTTPAPASPSPSNGRGDRSTPRSRSPP